MKKILIITMMTAYLFAGGAAPFGLKPGMKIENIDSEAKKVTETIFYISPPKPHKYFKIYKVWVDPKIGLYQLEATTPPIITKSTGEKIKEEFNTIYSKLKNIYGKPSKSIDYLPEDSYLTDRFDYMDSLKSGERKRYVRWDINKRTKSKIQLSIRGINSYSGKIKLQYQFKNYRKVLKEERSRIERAKREKEKIKHKKEKKIEKESPIF